MSGDAERVFRALVAEIAESRLVVGERLPAPDELSRRFAAGAAAVDGALGALGRHGIVQSVPGGGVAVGPESEWDVLDPHVLKALVASRRGPAVLAEYLEYRRLVEVVAAGMAAEHATADDLAALADALAEMTAAAEVRGADAEARFHAADVLFHQALLAAGRNRPLELAAAPLQAALCTARQPLARPELRQARGLPEHQRILAAVARADPDAARDAMEAHLDSVEAYLREYAAAARSAAGRDDR